MASSSRKGRLGLALASGGLMGGIYEVGALRALEESIQGLDLNQLHVYVGVSAGAFVGSHLVNGITVTDMVRALHDDPGSGTSFDTSIFFHPALQELRRRGLQVPWVIADLLKQFLNGKEPSSLLGRIGGLGPSLPVCFFDNEAIRAHLHKLFSMRGRTDDFRKLSRRFFVVATDLETGEAVLFGKGGLDHVPISRAVQASSAVPGLYQPVEVEGRVCVDGVLLKTLHSTVALDNHYQVDAFHTDLKTPASSADGEERRRAPAFCCAAGGDTFAALCAEHKSALNQVGHDSDAFSVIEHLFWNAFVRRGHHFVKYRSGMLETVCSGFTCGVSPGEG